MISLTASNLMSQKVGWSSMLMEWNKIKYFNPLEVSEREEGVVVLHLPTHWAFNKPLLVRTGTEMQTQHLPAH